MNHLESSIQDSAPSKSLINLQQLLFEYPNKSNVSIHFSILSSPVLIIWRFIAFAAISVRMWFVFGDSTSLFFAFQYLTQFGFHFSWLYFCSVCIDWLLSHFPSVILPNLSDTVNLLFQISWCFQVPITILYWGVLFDFSKSYEAIDIIRDIGVHGFPFFCLSIDFILNCYQFPWRHLPVILLLGLFYLLVNLIYTLQVKPIYEPIDWESTMSYIWVVMAIVVVVAVHVLSHLVWFKFRKNRIQKSTERSLLSERLF